MVRKKRLVNYRLLLIILLLIPLLTSTQEVFADRTDLIYRIPITGKIDNGLLNLVKRGIDEAEDVGADLIIFEIDTYGGYVDPAVKIRDLIMNTPIPTVTYVKGRAWSAGALIALSGERLVMARGSSMGAAETRPYEEKYISAFRKEFKSTAETRGKNPDLAAAMVDKDIEVDGITDKGKLLTLTAREAVDNKMADNLVDNIQDLYTNLDYSPGSVKIIEMTMAEKAARVITDPYLTTILLTIGIIALVAEVMIAGFGLFGTVGLISLALVFSSHIYFDGATWGVAILFLVGLVLLALEVFVVPGFGITGIGGLAAIFISIYFLFPTVNSAIIALAVIMTSTVVGFILILKIFGSSRLWKNISLGESQTIEAGYVAQNDKKSLIGKVGVTVSMLRPAGIAEIEGERVDVVSEGEYIDKGEDIIVYKIAGNRIVVKKIKGE